MSGSAIKRMDHVGLNVADLDAAKAFFVELGMQVLGEMPMQGELLDGIVGFTDARTDIVMLATPDGASRIELVTWHQPTAAAPDPARPPHAPGLSHLCFNVDDLDATLERLRPLGATLVGEIMRYEDIFRLCYVRGPEGVIVELAEDVVAG